MTKSKVETRMKKLASQQLTQSLQGFTIPSPSKCKDYGTEYELEKLGLLPKILLTAGLIFMLFLCAKLFPYVRI